MFSLAPVESHQTVPEKTFWLHQARHYVLKGLRICQKDIVGLLILVGIFELPPLLALLIGSQTGPVSYWIAWSLPWITITLGNITIVLAIEALDAGSLIVPARILPAAVRWLPRYLWTNGITSVLFWGIFTPLQWLISVETARWPWLTLTLSGLLLLPMLFWHVRLVFATYAAIIDDQPGLRSVRISIGIARGRWVMVVAAFVGSFIIVAPLAGPLYLLILGVHNGLQATAYEWMLVMPLRPLFIATLHLIYQEYRPAHLLHQLPDQA